MKNTSKVFSLTTQRTYTEHMTVKGSVFRGRRTLTIAALIVAAAATSLRAWGLEVYFLRHGETTWNRAKILQGSVPYTDLTKKGVRMAEETAKGMMSAGIRFDRVYTSPYRRARHTAEIVSAGGVGPEPVVDARIREMCFGRYEGVRYGKGDYPDDNLRQFFEDADEMVEGTLGGETPEDLLRERGARRSRRARGQTR